MKVLVTGGAGYIGSHTVKQLLDKGHAVIIYDNLSTGNKALMDKRAVFIKGDLLDSEKLEQVFSEHKPEAVIHFAASIEVELSVSDPVGFYKNNVVTSLNLLRTMVKYKVGKIIYSSSAAVYGIPEKVPIKETDKIQPINPYGETKVVVENLLKACEPAYGMRFISLRYFNVAGASLDNSLGEMRPKKSHLIPIVLEAALGKRKELQIFGNDYDTRDGTCVRDYIHVVDLANAHILALESLEKNGKSNTYNLGSEKGYSVKEVVDMCKQITGKDFAVVEVERRAGDPPELVASSEKIKKELGWNPQHTDLKTIVKTEWEWAKNQ